jgi:glutamate/tyrosine decarboxylase-like PLP-dependent enzyme
MSGNEFDPYFLGPYGENADLFEELLIDFVRDHVYWRRNFHPESTPPISTSARYSEEFLDVAARMRRELFALSADLKKSVPWFSPRYVGHMSSDLLMPGLIANLVTTLYNPNNVSDQAAPATVEKEIEVGFQLARMFGWAADPEQRPCAWGHLTSGGSVANYEGLRNLCALKYYPLALARALEELDLDLGTPGPLSRPLADYSDWELSNLPVDQVIELRHAHLREANLRGPDTVRALRKATDAQRLENSGWVDFFGDHPNIKPPVVLVPKTSHYSWPKSMKLLGLGTSNLVRVEVDQNMRMQIDDLRDVLDRLADEERPVLAVVAVLGTTEFGTVDPLGDIVEERERRLEQGLYFPVHVDAAWGGYLASIFRREDGGLVERERLQEQFRYFPSQTVYDAFAALAEVESITVDPHKLGYIPYPAGAYVARNSDMIDFVTDKAPYAFEGSLEEKVDLRERLRNLGQYILEGSKPGASAASVHVSHKVLPLHTDAFGALLKQSVQTAEYFYDRARELAERLEDEVIVDIPFEPDCNLVCLTFNPVDNRSAAGLNRFVQSIYDEMRVDASRPIQVRSFFASSTSLQAADLSPEHLAQLAQRLGLDENTLREAPDQPRSEASSLLLIRNTLMNPWLGFEENGRNYIDMYLDFLEERIRAELARPSMRGHHQ